MHAQEWSCRIKSVRQKRRLVKTDRDKQLIQLDKQRAELNNWFCERDKYINKIKNIPR